MSYTKLFAISALTLANLPAQQKGAPAPPPVREVTITAIPGVIAAGAQWKLVWQGRENADGLSGSEDGGILFAQEQTNSINKLDKNDQFSVFLKNGHGPGAVSVGRKNRVVVTERTCTDPGQKPAECKEPTGIAALTPERKVLANSIDGKSFGRVNDLTISKKDHVYFTSGGVFHITPKGQVSTVGENIRANGITLSTDEKTLYVTNQQTVVAFDIDADGTPKNQREFAKLQGGGGDGMIVDAAGRLYVTDQSQGIQVFDKSGMRLGLIPTPRNCISAVFSGPGKKFLYVSMLGSLGPDGKEATFPPGARNTAMSIYKIPMEAAGFKGRLR